MTPTDLRAITLTLDDERGTGGQSRLARLLGWHHSTVWRKLTGKSPITQSDELDTGEKGVKTVKNGQVLSCGARTTNLETRTEGRRPEHPIKRARTAT